MNDQSSITVTLGDHDAFDLILRGGRVTDPSQKLDAVMDAAFAAGKVAMVVPSLIDLHGARLWGGTSLGIDAEEFCRTSGVTTAVDTGSAGPGNFAGFRKHVIEPSEVRILAYLASRAAPSFRSIASWWARVKRSGS